MEGERYVREVQVEREGERGVRERDRESEEG